MSYLTGDTPERRGIQPIKWKMEIRYTTEILKIISLNYFRIREDKLQGTIHWQTEKGHITVIKC